MRWFLPLLVVAFAPASFADLAVYTGSLTSQQVDGSAPAGDRLRVAEVIDLQTGDVITITLTREHGTNSSQIGPVISYVITKLDLRGRGTVTALGEASTGTDSETGSMFAVASFLRGRDARVTLKAGSPSQWPRTLVGLGNLVATAGTDSATGDPVPAHAASSVIVLTLNERLSQSINDGETLAEAAQSVATALTAPPSTTGTNSVIQSGGVTFQSSGSSSTLQLTNTAGGNLTLGSAQLGASGATTSTTTTAGGATIISGGGSLTITGINTNPLSGTAGVSNGILNRTLGGTTTVSIVSGGLTLTRGTGITSGNAINGTITSGGGTLLLSQGSLGAVAINGGILQLVHPATGTSTINSSGGAALTVVGSPNIVNVTNAGTGGSAVSVTINNAATGTRLNSGSNTFSGTTTVTNGTWLTNTGASTTTVGGILQSGTGVLNLAGNTGANTTTAGGILKSGTGILNLAVNTGANTTTASIGTTGAGTLTLGGTTYTGNTTINGGVLTLNSTTGATLLTGGTVLTGSNGLVLQSGGSTVAPTLNLSLVQSGGAVTLPPGTSVPVNLQ